MDDEVLRWFGPWEPWTPAQVGQLLRGWPHPWWIAGGHGYHCWAAGSGALRPLTAGEPRLPEWADRCWVRDHAGAPDLTRTLPRLDADARAWLRDTPARLHPGHRWLDRTAGR